MIDWAMWSAIGTISAAMVAAFGCLLSLWQVRYYNQKKVKLEFREHTIRIGRSPTQSRLKSEYAVIIDNIGNRRITVIRWGYRVGNGPLISIYPPYNLRTFPISIEPKNGISLCIPCPKFNKMIKSLNSDNEECVKFFIEDATLGLYEIDTKLRVKYFVDAALNDERIRYEQMSG